MRVYKVGICSRDPEYAASLMMAVKEMSDGRMEAIVYSRPEVIVTCRVLQEPDLILLDTRTGPDGAEGDPEPVAAAWGERLGLPVVALTEEPSEFCIYKYQSVRVICTKILEILQKAGAVSSQPSGCIAVFSPLGRCGKTTLARALAGAKAEHGGLYIGMEEYADRRVRSEVLYQIKQRSPDVYEAVNREMMTEDGVPSLHLAGMYPDLRGVQKEDLEWFFGQLLQPGRLQNVVFDIGGAALEGPELLECFDRIYLPCPPGEHAAAKLRQFRDYMRERAKGEVLLRIIPVELSGEVVERADRRELLALLGR